MPEPGILSAPAIPIETLTPMLSVLRPPENSDKPWQPPQAYRDMPEITNEPENIYDCPEAMNNQGNNCLLGLHTLENGLSFFGYALASDWSHPVFYIIYFDGERLHGYMPSCGNLVNFDTMSAIGMEDESDFARRQNEESYNTTGKDKYEPDELFAQYLSKYEIQSIDQLVLNWSAIKADIMTAIKII